jgi:hypothetical protein
MVKFYNSKEKIKMLKLFITVVFIGFASLSAVADTFKDEASGLYFSTNEDGTCSVVKPTDGTYSGDIVIPSTVTYNGTEYRVTSIGLAAFSSCTALTSITIPEGVTSINYATFMDCSSLTSITIPNGVTSIAPGTFWGCTSLTSVSIPDGVTSIENFAFFECTSLVGITTKAFTGEEQNVLVIPNNVTSIGQNAFYKCTSLEHIWLGSSVKAIDTEAFYGCISLESVSPTATTAPTLAANAFSDDTYTNAQLLLPVKATDSNYETVLASYQSTDNNWYKFAKGILTDVKDVSSDNVTVKSNGMTIEVTGYEGEINIYNVTGMRVYQGNDKHIELPNPDIYVVIVNGKSYKVAIK